MMYFYWMDGAMHPLPRFREAAMRLFETGKRYQLDDMDEVQAASSAERRRYFACVREAWMQLPESKTEQYPTPNHLRRWALIKCGFHDQRSIACSSKEEAARVASFIKPMDSYAVVVLKDDVVSIYTAKSQRVRAMDKKTFQTSSRAVLDCLSEAIGVTRKQLEMENP